MYSQTEVAYTHIGGHMQTWRSSSNVRGKYAHDKIMCTNKRPFTLMDTDGVHARQLDVPTGVERSPLVRMVVVLDSIRVSPWPLLTLVLHLT